MPTGILRKIGRPEPFFFSPMQHMHMFLLSAQLVGQLPGPVRRIIIDNQNIGDEIRANRATMASRLFGVHCRWSTIRIDRSKQNGITGASFLFEATCVYPG